MPWSKVIVGSAVVALVALASVGGYLFGHGEAATKLEAQNVVRAARGAAFESARREARIHASKRGRTAGVKNGRLEGQQSGSANGSSDARRDIAAEQEAAAEVAAPPSTDPYDYALDTPGPPPTGTSCPPPYQYDMGACVISRPATASECPPGWEPAGITGACGPASRP
jgi:hypothetical protein